jgi:HAD superfamily hydrolase (TIGR01662 family)
VISYSVVIPTIGRPCLRDCLAALGAASGPAPEQVVVVDDRPARSRPLDVAGGPGWSALPLRIVTSGGAGPAAARNAGWQVTAASWVAFLDDDVRVSEDWRYRLAEDLAGLPPRVAGVQGRIVVPIPRGRRPTDWERNTQGLAGASWITADMAYRRVALAEAGGFDERFPRAFREDADLALRLRADGWQLRRGQRRTVHPVRPASPWVSLRSQAGNADDALMRVLHGAGWHERARAPRGRPSHVLITGALLAAAGLAAARPRSVRAVRAVRAAAAVTGAVALGGTAQFAVMRVRPGPKTAREIATMAVTSLVIPELACWHWLRGRIRARGARPWPPVRAVLFDRDGTLIRDVPYNGDPGLVEPVPGAAAAVRAVRRHGLAVAMITNQSGIARGLLGQADAEAVNARVSQLLGPFDAVRLCPHGESEECGCRKPAPGMVLAAAAELGVAPRECVVVGDIGADVAAARAAGARGVLVPTPQTSPAELAGVRVAGDLAEAVRMITGEIPLAPVWPNGDGD